MKQIHATAISYNNDGILILGDSGSGKSDLALRLIDKGAVLIGDDYIQIDKDNNLYPADNIKGLIEVRNIGILRSEFIEKIELKLVIELVDSLDKLERMPEVEYNNLKIRKYKLYPFEISAPIKVLKILEIVNNSEILIE